MAAIKQTVTHEDTVLISLTDIAQAALGDLFDPNAQCRAQIIPDAGKLLLTQFSRKEREMEKSMDKEAIRKAVA